MRQGVNLKIHHLCEDGWTPASPAAWRPIECTVEQWSDRLVVFCGRKLPCPVGGAWVLVDKIGLKDVGRLPNIYPRSMSWGLVPCKFNKLQVTMKNSERGFWGSKWNFTMDLMASIEFPYKNFKVCINACMYEVVTRLIPYIRSTFRKRRAFSRL